MNKRTRAEGITMQVAKFAAAEAEVGPEPQEVSKEPSAPPLKKLDGRTLQATGRTHQFATRIKAETHQKMLEIVQREKAEGQPRFTLAELIELAVDAYERERTGRG
ncbi:hypothetical protein IPV08_23460 [Methylobacterium sp. SD274]|uniref:hypothetical protein n=1 Tax=Methylobacterium sp. SD274 TaxID=2782009 RepID=UPI001A971C15|nr:hypothetical protein [Methylobacterium sp. SD274]MBO1022919.1 hypothetical protein [Methylobacterium sp. SD274]